MKAGAITSGAAALPRGVPGPVRWRLVTLLVVWLAAMGVGYAVYQRVSAPTTTAPKGQVVAVQRGTIAATVSTTGSVVATTSSKLSFKSTGTLTELLVRVGENVRQDQPLARLDQTDLKLQLTQAQAQLASAQSKLTQVQQGSRKEDLAAAAASLASAKAQLAQVQAGPTNADLQAAQAAVATAKNNLVSAQAKLATLQAQPNPDDVKTAQLSLEKAKNSLWATQISRDGTCHSASSKEYQCQSANAQVAAAETDVTSAQASLQKVSQPATADDLKAAQEAVTSAQTAYNSAVAKQQQTKSGATAADIAAAKSTVDAATSAFAAKQSPYTDADLKDAQASVDQAKASVALAEYQLSNATLVAPFAGTVAAIGMNVGESTSAQSIITLVDPKAVRIDATVDESEVAKMELGQRADITFDALSGRSYSGKVIAISPSGTVQSGVVTYLVSLSVDDPTGLKPGMTANANVVYSQKDNAVMVPNRAVRAQGRNRVVEVETGSGTVVRPVQVGISNDQYTEITDGLSDGDQVLVPSTTTSAPRVGGGPGGGGFGGPRGGGFGG